MARRILNRKDLRADFEAAERRKQEDDTEEEEDEDEDGDESDEEAESAEEGADGEEEEEAPKKKKKKVVAKVAKPKRTRTAKQVRMKVIWGVFNNSNQCVARFDYPKRKEAEEHAAKLSAAKTPPQSFFIQPVREPIEDK